MFEIGQIVISKSGRDKGKPFIVFRIEGEYLYLVDGQVRKIEKPKKKKMKHVQHTLTVNSELKEKIEHEEYLQDAFIRKVLKTFREEK